MQRARSAMKQERLIGLQRKSPGMAERATVVQQINLERADVVRAALSPVGGQPYSGVTLRSMGNRSGEQTKLILNLPATITANSLLAL